MFANLCRKPQTTFVAIAGIDETTSRAAILSEELYKACPGSRPDSPRPCCRLKRRFSLQIFVFIFLMATPVLIYSGRDAMNCTSTRRELFKIIKLIALQQFVIFFS